MIVKDKGLESEDGQWGEGRGKGEGTGWAKGLLIRRISKEGPISNIKDESDRSEDDPGRSKGIQAMTEAKEGRS